MAAVVAAFMACQSKPQNNVEEVAVIASDSAGVMDITEIYQGTLPAADGPGINYLLTLNEEINGKDTLFSLDMLFLDAEGPGKHTSFTTKGKQQHIQKRVNKNLRNAVKLTPEAGNTPMYFMIVNDTTLRMVNDNLVEITNDQSYDIVRVDAKKK